MKKTLMLLMVALLLGCATTRFPDGTIAIEPIDQVTEQLVTNIMLTIAQIARERNQQQRDDLHERLRLLREELQQWQEWLSQKLLAGDSASPLSSFASRPTVPILQEKK